MGLQSGFALLGNYIQTVIKGLKIRLRGSTSGYVELAAPAVAPSITITFPNTAPGDGQTVVFATDGTMSWASAGSGDVVGPSSAADGDVAVFNSTTGKLLKEAAIANISSTRMYVNGLLNIGTDTPQGKVTIAQLSNAANVLLSSNGTYNYNAVTLTANNTSNNSVVSGMQNNGVVSLGGFNYAGVIVGSYTIALINGIGNMTGSAVGCEGQVFSLNQGTSERIQSFLASNAIGSGNTVNNNDGFRAIDPMVTGSLVNNVGFSCGDMTAGSSTNIGIELMVSSGTGKKNINATGTADNYIAGATTFGSTVNATGAVTGSNLSGTNTGDQDLSSYATSAAVIGYAVPLTRTVNGHALSGNISISASDVGAPSGSGTSSGTNTGDQTISDATITTTDITTNNVSTSKHGFVPKAPNDATKYLDGTGAYSTPAGAGSVTTVSVVSANGFAGTVANASSTPAITISTMITGLLKGNATAISAATAGTDYSAGTSALATGILKSTTSTGGLTIAVAGDFPTLNQDTTGSAATLTTARTINGTSFNGSANITITAAAGTLTGATLNSSVVTSSLTTVGTLATGVWQATKVGLAYGGTNADLSGTGGTSQVLMQATTGAAITVGQLAASNLSNGTTGTGAVVLVTSPTLVTPVLGDATATSINKVIITSVATTATFTLANNKTFTVSNTLTFTGTDTSSVAFGAGGTVAYVANKLSVFAATTSSELAGVISDETGTGALVFANTPTLVTPVLGVATGTSIALTGGNFSLTTGQATLVPLVLTSSSNSIAWNANSGNNARHVATENTTLANPTNMVDGTVYTFRWKQHASAAKTLAFGSKWKFVGSSTVSTTVNAVCTITGMYNSTDDVIECTMTVGPYA